MTINTCDNCNKVIKEHEGLTLITQGYYARVELCKLCATPILDTIIDQQLLTAELNDKLLTEDPLIEELKKLEARKASRKDLSKT